MHYKLFRKCGNISFPKMRCSSSGLHSLSLSVLSFLLSLVFLIVPISATGTFYDNNELYFRGTVKYVGSSWGTPVDNLNGEIHQFYCSSESERCLLIKPYVSNSSESSIIGYVDNGLTFSIPFGGRIEINQLHTNGEKQRSSTAYYDVEIDDIQTNLLFRPARNDFYIKIIMSLLLVFSLICVFRLVRHD